MPRFFSVICSGCGKRSRRPTNRRPYWAGRCRKCGCQLKEPTKFRLALADVFVSKLMGKPAPGPRDFDRELYGAWLYLPNKQADLSGSLRAVASEFSRAYDKVAEKVGLDGPRVIVSVDPFDYIRDRLAIGWQAQGRG